MAGHSDRSVPSDRAEGLELRGYVLLIETAASLEVVRETIEQTLQIELRHAHGGTGVLSLVAGLLGLVATTPEAWFLLARNPLREKQGFDLGAYEYALLMHPRGDAESYASATLDALKVHGWSMLLIRGLAEPVGTFEPTRG